MFRSKSLQLFLIVMFIAPTILMASVLDILKPCYEMLDQSPNSPNSPRPRGNSHWVATQTAFSNIGEPLAFTFDTAILPIAINTPKKSPAFEILIFNKNEKGELRVSRKKITRQTLNSHKGVVLPVVGSCSKPVGSSALAVINTCWSMPLTVHVGSYSATLYDLESKKIKESRVVMTKQILDKSTIADIQDKQDQTQALQNIDNIDTGKALAMLIEDLSLHMKYLFDRPLFTEGEAGKNTILNTLKKCKIAYSQLLEQNFTDPNMAKAVQKLGEGIKHVDVTDPNYFKKSSPATP